MCMSLFQSGYSLAHDAAGGGNVQLLDWLVAKYKLDVHEWNEASLSACVT